MRKPHARSRLKTLSPDRQKALYEHLCTHTLEEAEAWLATDGVETSRTPLSEFFAWYPLSLKLSAAASMGDAVKEILRELPGLNLDEQKLSQAGQAIFEAEALQRGDSELYVSLRKLRQEDTKAAQKAEQLAQKEREITLAIDKFQFDAAKAVMANLAELKAIAADRALSAPEKVKAVQLKLFGTPRTALELPSAE